MEHLGLAILVPVLGRPHRVRPFLAGVEQTVPGAHVVFIGDPHDQAQREAIEAYSGPVKVSDHYPGGNYASKIRFGVEATDEPLIFTGADDLEFRPNWLKKAKVHLGNGCEVVGVNDLCSERVKAGVHATHFLMTRAYAERSTIDGQPGPFFDGYSHWFCDDELVATAKHRGAIRFALDAHVAHLHPMTGTAPDDETYKKGRSRRRRDRKLFQSREHLWTPRSA